MTEAEIVSLYWQRQESAIAQSESLLGRYLFTIANSILHNEQDAHE